MSSGFVLAKDDGALLRLRVSPGAKRTSITGPHGEDALKVSVAAPPVDGKANAEVRRFLARLLGTPGSEVEVVRGSSSRYKTVFVGGIDAAGVRKILSEEAF